MEGSIISGLLGLIDSKKRSVKRGLLDMVSNPSDSLDMLNDRAANFNRNVEPVISGGVLQNRPLTEEEIQKKHTDLAMSFAPIGMTAWHGSPHKFDKFDLSKIGTGEGAQAYGHGLYLAESPKVAKEYQKNLSQFSRIDGRPLVGNKTISSGARTFLLAENADLPKAIQNARDAIARKPDNELLPPILKELESLNPDSITKSSTGQLYKTDIPDEAVARFLDWDKPLSQQVEHLSKLSDAELYNLGITREGMDAFTGKPLMGGDLMKFSDNQHGGGWLGKKGIPGIRYLDGNSRPKNVIDKRLYSLWEENGKNAEAAVDQYMRGVHNTPARKQQIRDGLLKELQAYQGTSNFVVFDPEMIRILERNGQATGLLPWQPGEYQGLLKMKDKVKP